MKELFGPIKPTNEHSSSTMTVLISHAGVGKTTLATTAQDLGFCVLVNFENRLAHIEETENLRFYPKGKNEFRNDTLCTYDDMEMFRKAVKKKSKADYLIIDTIDSMFDYYISYYKSKGTFPDQRQIYSLVYAEIYEILKEFKDSGSNIILTSHVVNDPVINKMTISLNEKLRNKLNIITDNVFYLDIMGDGQRILYLKDTPSVKCKLTTKGVDAYNNTPNDIINPSWKDIEIAIGLRQGEEIG